MTIASTPSAPRPVAGEPATSPTVPPASTPRRVWGTPTTTVATSAAPTAVATLSADVLSTARRAVANRTILASWTVVYAALVWTVGWPEAAARYAFAPLLLGIVVLGLPHGALDPWVPARVGFAWGRRWRPVTAYMVGYLALIVLYLWAWRLAPTWAFGGFLVATVVHWGHGDLRYLEDLHRRYDVGLRGSIAAIALRGAIPIVVPVLAHPHEAESLLQHAARVLGSGVVSIDLSSTTVRVVGWTALALAAAAYAWTSRRAWPSRRGAWIDACEVVGLATFFVIVPAYLAVGAYFMGWHALRHLARLVLLQPRDVRALARGDHLRPALRLARDLVPMTGLAAAMLVGLYLWARPHVVGTEGFVALYLVWISALTKPHLLVVAAMDLAPGTRERAGRTPSSA